jgi:tRNA pseudouridine65 synthase
VLAAGPARRRAPLSILHADEAVVAVDKPAGLAAHRSRLVGHDDAYLVDAVREATGRTWYLAHRLDRATSGVTLLAASPAIAAALGAQFMARDVDKVYLAVCRGWLEGTGTIEHPLDAPGKPEPKPATTHWRALARAELAVALGRYPTQRYTLLEVRPQTGRYRQIRRHFHHVSHHLIGDTSHGRGDHNRLFRQQLGVQRLLLHAWRLGFEHPLARRWLTIEAPLDADWQRVLARFDWHAALPM